MAKRIFLQNIQVQAAEDQLEEARSNYTQRVKWYYAVDKGRLQLKWHQNKAGSFRPLFREYLHY